MIRSFSNYPGREIPTRRTLTVVDEFGFEEFGFVGGEMEAAFLDDLLHHLQVCDKQWYRDFIESDSHDCDVTCFCATRVFPLKVGLKGVRVSDFDEGLDE